MSKDLPIPNDRHTLNRDIRNTIAKYCNWGLNKAPTAEENINLEESLANEIQDLLDTSGLQIDMLLSSLPKEILEDPSNPEEVPLVLYIERFRDSWSAFYAPEFIEHPDEPTIYNGTLTASGGRLNETLAELLHSYRTDFKVWQENQ